MTVSPVVLLDYSNTTAVSESSLFQRDPTFFWSTKLSPASLPSIEPRSSRVATDSAAAVDIEEEESSGNAGRDGGAYCVAEECSHEGGGWTRPDVVITFEGYLTVELLAALSSHGMTEVIRMCCGMMDVASRRLRFDA